MIKRIFKLVIWGILIGLVLFFLVYFLFPYRYFVLSKLKGMGIDVRITRITPVFPPFNFIVEKASYDKEASFTLINFHVKPLISTFINKSPEFKFNGNVLLNYSALSFKSKAKGFIKFKDFNFKNFKLNVLFYDGLFYIGEGLKKNVDNNIYLEVDRNGKNLSVFINGKKVDFKTLGGRLFPWNPNFLR